MKLIALMTAPAYMSRTAVCTEVGGADGGAGSGIWFPPAADG